MKYAIRHLGSSDFFSGFSTNPWERESVWVEGWDNSDMLLYPTYEAALADQDLVTADGLNSIIEEIS